MKALKEQLTSVNEEMYKTNYKLMKKYENGTLFKNFCPVCSCELKNKGEKCQEERYGKQGQEERNLGLYPHGRNRK